MRRTRRSTRKEPVVESSSDSEDDIPLKKLRPTPKKNNPKSATAPKPKEDGTSSSESDIENYLQRVDTIDFSSPFFNTQKKTENEFEKIEKNMFSGVTRLSDSSDSEMEDVKVEEKPADQPETVKEETKPPDGIHETKLNFHQLEEYSRKLEEAKKRVDEYNAKKKSEDAGMDISNLLAKGESKQITLENIKEEDLHPSDFESSEDDWEEVKVKDQQENKEKPVPKAGIEITVGEMPDHCKKKKGVDLLAAMKRRLNRIRKENQVHVHKVHLLCWIAHGNFVNSVLNSTNILGLALSLLPSDKCYPSNRTDLGYLEQIVQWYKKTIKITERPPPQELQLANSLQLQIRQKEAFDKKMYVLIFIAILRALGIQCRLVFSLQVEPLRPPASELHSLSKEGDNKKVDGKKKAPEKSVGKSGEAAGTTKKASSSRSHDKDKKHIKVETGESKEKQKESSSTKPRDSKTGKRNTESTKSKYIKEEGTHAEKDKSTGSQRKRSLAKGKDSKEVKTIGEKVKLAESNKVSRSKSASDKKEVTKKEGDNVASSSRETRTSSRSTKGLDSKTRSSKESDYKSSRSKSVDSKSTRTKSNSDVKEKPSRTRKAPSQLDGADDSSDVLSDVYMAQLDGTSDEKSPKPKTKSSKPNLKKLKTSERTCPVKKHASRLEDYNSEDEFLPSPQKSDKASKKPNLSRLRSSTSNVPPKRQMDVKNDIINLIKGRISEQKHLDRSRMVKKPAIKYEGSSSDSDYVPEPVKKKHHDSDSDLEYFVPKPKVKKRVSVKRERPGAKIVSDGSDLDESGKKKKKGMNVWVEVFLEAEDKWITADVVKGQVHCVREIHGRATHPVSYILAWNNDNTLKDVTLRYCKSFNTATRKLRVDPKWWEESLKPFLGKKTARDREEDDDLNRQQLDQPMPKAISEFKNHPLYALRRHLLKFEDIYPPEIQPLGYVRSEPVYPRNCVYVCKSRDIWLKEARVVKPGEKPYKIVKARPKYDRLSNKMITDQLLEIFGPWQTMDYDPPTAENGIVPRNAFGNVELFKACMLPKGTVHLKLPGLNKVCKKLNIDCASAIVGFDFHGGWSHPTYDGFVVCEEFEDQVVAAWNVEQEEVEKRENEKLDKRVYGNWKKLIRGLLIREKLKAKYDFGGKSSDGTKTSKKTGLKTNKRKIVSDSDSD